MTGAVALAFFKLCYMGFAAVLLILHMCAVLCFCQVRTTSGVCYYYVAIFVNVALMILLIVIGTS